MEQPDKVLNVATLAGRTLLASGAEIFRVQETMSRIIAHFGIEDYNVFVLANGIFADIGEKGERHTTTIRYVPLASVRLDRIASINQIARELCGDLCTLDEAAKRLHALHASHPFQPWVRMLASGVGAGCFAYLFGGSVEESCIAFCMGVALQLLLLRLAHVQKYLRLLLGGFCVTFLTVILLWMGAPLRLDAVVIGAIMPLVPGTVFTTAIRELFNGDYLSATVHLLDAVTSAGCIATGVCGAILLAQMGGAL